MPISFTDDAVKLLTEIMDKQGLDIERFAFRVSLENNALSYDFTREIEGCKQIHNLKYFDDPRIEEDIVIANFRTSDGRGGIIFLGKNELAQ